jgi:hypothetical protein
MHQIHTQVDIHAGASLVWTLLTDFSRYPDWNPTIRGVQGPLEAGSTIKVAERLVQPKPGKPPTVTQTTGTLDQIREPRRLSWSSRLGFMLGSERRFRIENLPDGGVRFHQEERIGGLLAPFLWRRLVREREPAFERMNRALKSRAERVEARAPRTNG